MLAHYAQVMDKTSADPLLFATDASFIGRQDDVTYSQPLEHLKI